MAITRTISVVKGKGSIAHNNREFIAENVIEERMVDDICYKKEKLEDAYEHLFGDAIREYNAKQKRADRRIDGIKGYIDKLKNSKNGEKLFYENVIQVGNMHDCKVGSADGEKAKAILDKYMQDFQERNPNLYVFNAVLHMDEQTPHLHIDYIPVAHGYKQGLQARNSLDKALGEQGVNGKSNKYENRTNKWQEQEKDHIETIMHEYGYERAEEKGIKAPKLSVAAYKAAVGEIENQLQQLPNHIDSKPMPLNKDKVIVNAADLVQLERSAKLVDTHKKALQEVYSAEKNKLNDLSEMRNVSKKDMFLALQEKNNSLELKQQAEKLYNEQKELNSLYKYAQFENKVLKERVNELTEENGKLRKLCNKLKAIVNRIAPRKEFIKPTVNLFTDQRQDWCYEGRLVAIYKDGTECKVDRAKYSQIISDAEAGLCSVGRWASEKTVTIPERLYKELLSRQNNEIKPSRELNDFISFSESKMSSQQKIKSRDSDYER